MINPETVSKLKLLKKLVNAHGGGSDLTDFNQIVGAFTANETLTKAQAKKANQIYKRLKRFK